MTEKKLEKIVRRNKRRKVAQGIGAGTAVLVWMAAIGAYIVGEGKLDQFRPTVKDILEKEKAMKEAEKKAEEE